MNSPTLGKVNQLRSVGINCGIEMALLPIVFLKKEMVSHYNSSLSATVGNSKVPPYSQVGAREAKVEHWVGWIELPQA